MLATHAEFQFPFHFAATLGCNLHQLADTGLVDGVEGISLQQPELEVPGHHATLDIVTTQSEGHLGEVVGAEAEEVSVLSQIFGSQGGTRSFDHRADGDYCAFCPLAGWCAARQVGKFAQHALHPSARQRQLVIGNGEWNHDFDDRLEAFTGNLLGRLHECADLHGVQTRFHHTQSHATGSQHGVDFGPFAGCVQHFGFLCSETRRCLLHLELVYVRQELMQRWIEQANRDRQSVHRSQDADEVFFLGFTKLLERRSFFVGGVGQNHSTHHGQTISRQEHVLGTTQADSFGAERSGNFGIVRRVGIGAHVQFAFANVVRPFQDGVELGRWRGCHQLECPEHDVARGTIDGDGVAFPHHHLARHELPAVDLYGFGTHDGRCAPPTRHHGSVTHESPT